MFWAWFVLVLCGVVTLPKSDGANIDVNVLVSSKGAAMSEKAVCLKEDEKCKNYAITDKCCNGLFCKKPTGPPWSDIKCSKCPKMGEKCNKHQAWGCCTGSYCPRLDEPTCIACKKLGEKCKGEKQGNWACCGAVEGKTGCDYNYRGNGKCYECGGAGKNCYSAWIKEAWCCQKGLTCDKKSSKCVEKSLATYHPDWAQAMRQQNGLEKEMA